MKVEVCAMLEFLHELWQNCLEPRRVEGLGARTGKSALCRFADFDERENVKARSDADLVSCLNSKRS